MTMPMISQPINRSHVTPFRLAIRANDTRMPMTGTKGTQGVRKGRSRSGLLTRKIQTAAHTITNARRVPILTICPRLPIGTSEPKMAAHNPTTAVVFQGVRKRGWMSPAHFQRRPSCAMEYFSCDYPKTIEIYTLLLHDALPLVMIEILTVALA